MSTSDSASDYSDDFTLGLTRDSLHDQMDRLGMDSTAALQPSTLLLRYYRYWSLEDLRVGLEKLSKEVDNDLVDLVNKNYLRFIELGKSLDGSLDMTHDVKFDLASYVRQLGSANKDIRADLASVDRVVQYRTRLVQLKRLASMAILLEEEMDTLSKLTNDPSADFQDLAMLFFSINRQYAELVRMAERLTIKETELLITLGKKLAGVKMEFRSLVKAGLKNRSADSFEMLKLYEVVEEME